MLKQQQNLSGDEKAALQGFGRVTTDSPPVFDPGSAIEAASSFFTANGYVVLSACLDQVELDQLNEFYDRTQEERPHTWGLRNDRKPHHQQQGLIFSQPLLDYPELDPYTQHRRSFPVVASIFGGEKHVRFSEFNFREAPENAGIGAMNFHHDAVSADRFTRNPYMPCDWLCAIHYLTDVEPGTPAFCVVPKSNTYNTLKDAFQGLGETYLEVPIYGAAGTCVLYDTAIFHTRLDGDGVRSRRTWHQYYARGGWLPTNTRYVRPPTPVLTNWNLFPERLALHPDPKTRLFFSHWNTAQCEWVASGFADRIRESMPRGSQ
ncbi:MAG: phytanoyl-CoA dioxygenase family protein [Pseudomonadales bacterium]|nr:phytanoyl-CoA dioxygenase family protein [Pseudomonadales bacterium]MED5556132.1 phytanoyl-CoA dioxygenase family protein [Pseudomonadota bacterium]